MSVLVQHCLAYFLGRKCLGSAPIALCHPSLAESLLPLSVAGVRNIPQQGGLVIVVLEFVVSDRNLRRRVGNALGADGDRGVMVL